MALSIRERIRTVQAAVLNGPPVTPELARESVMTLTALLGYVGDELRDADIAYRTVLLEAYRTEGKGNRARMVADVSPEYRRMREAKDAEKAVEQLIVTCRGYLRSLETEMKLSR